MQRKRVVLRLFFMAVVLLAARNATATENPTSDQTPALQNPPEGSQWESFDGETTTWVPLGGDTRYRITQHRRSPERARAGRACEQITLVASNGTAIYLAHPVQASRVIHEMIVRIWVRSERPGVQLMVRVVLPRTTDPASGLPLTTIVRGPWTTATDRWEALELSNLAEKLAQQITALRAESGPQVDAREAYVDQVLINAYTGPGSNTLCVDDLVVTASVPPPVSTAVAPVNGVSSPAGAASALLAAAAGPLPLPREPLSDVRLRGRTLEIAGRPVLPRMIRYQGEPLEFLHGLGFNLVVLDILASPEILDEARRAGIGLISPPPPDDQWNVAAGPTEWDPVVAWSLGESLSGGDLDEVRVRSRLVRKLDPRPERPHLAGPDSGLRSFSRAVDLLLCRRDPLGTSLTLDEHGKWLVQRSLLALPGTPFWARIPTERPPRLVEQQRAVAGEAVTAGGVDLELIDLLWRGTLAAGVRGLAFDSRRPLTAIDPETRRRALTLELVNLELSLIEPWVAGGSQITAVRSSQADLSGVLLHAQSEKARILLPLRSEKENQFVPAAVNSPLTFLVPGVPEANSVYELTPVGLRPLAHKRVAGGVRVALDELDCFTMLLMTQDPVVIGSLTERLSRVRTRALEIITALATEKLALVDAVGRYLLDRRVPATNWQAALGEAAQRLRHTESLRGSGNPSGQFEQLRRGWTLLGIAQRGQWQQVASHWGLAVSSPLAVQHETIAWDHQFSQKLATWGRTDANRLAGGECEDLESMRDAGWAHYEFRQEGVDARVGLYADAPHSGRFALRLQAQAVSDQSAPAVLEATPVWVVTPPISLESAQLVRIHGWVRVAAPIQASVDGLLIADSLGGEPLAARIGQTNGWQEFTLFRAATSPGELMVTFAMTGLGAADLDDLTIEPVVFDRRPSGSPLNPTTTGPAPVR